MKNTEAAQADVEAMKALREDAALLLRAVRSSLADLLRRVMEGEGGALGQLTSKQAELESALRRALEAESKFHDWTQRNGQRDAGSGGGQDGIDFDAMRAEIGCRLHRLRTCG